MLRRRWVIITALVALGGMLATVAFVGGDLLSGSEGSAEPPPSPTESPSVPEGFVEFRDEQTGFALAYPRDWERLRPNDPQIRFAATLNGRDSMLVRVTPLGFEVGQEQLVGMEQFTARVVATAQGVNLLSPPQEIELAGLPGYLYLYTFKDPESGKRGWHSHYFLFSGETMVSLVFQALPRKRFDDLAPVFDEITKSFRVEQPLAAGGPSLNQEGDG